jgi:hypothetical protein
MAYSKAKLKSSGDKASPCFGPFWILTLRGRYLIKFCVKLITVISHDEYLPEYGLSDCDVFHWRRSSIFMDVAMYEHRTFDSEVFGCSKVY